ncbi:hypothetical protein PGB90_005867 [Kerria lacca]
MIGKWINVDGKRLLNFASHNYLNLIENDYVNTRAKNAIYKYGVGSCGPRGFYGTVDVHLELESHLANFMKTDRAIVYSYGFTTISSAIAAYVKKNDVVFADEKVNFAIQRGIEASRCKIFFFKHNDLADLERLLINFNSLVQDEKNNEYRSETKKFLIIEGIYMNSGRICPLPQLIEMRKRYKLRLLLDESVSFGVLGKNGRGVVEHFEANNEDVDMIMASMEYALGTGGGFCVGSAFIVEHQRLSGLGITTTHDRIILEMQEKTNTRRNLMSTSSFLENFSLFVSCGTALYLSIESIEYTKTKANSPQTNGKLYILQTRSAKCTSIAAIKIAVIAVDMMESGLIRYCFSASLPPFLAAAACAGIDVIQNENHRISKLSECCAKLHSSLSQSTILKNNFLLECDAPSPVKYLILKKAKRINTDDEKLNILNKIILYRHGTSVFLRPLHRKCWLLGEQPPPP